MPSDPLLWQEVADMDLGCVRARMQCDAYELPIWPDALLDQLELLYRRFFYLLCRYPQTRLTPSKAIDEMWHSHILFTRKYQHDCQNIAGHYLHHTPDDPLKPDAHANAQGFAATKQYYLEEFAEPLLVFVDA